MYLRDDPCLCIVKKVSFITLLFQTFEIVRHWQFLFISKYFFFCFVIKCNSYKIIFQWLISVATILIEFQSDSFDSAPNDPRTDLLSFSTGLSFSEHLILSSVYVLWFGPLVVYLFVNFNRIVHFVLHFVLSKTFSFSN